MKVEHAVDLIQTQGLQPLNKYFDRLREESGSKGGSKATRRLMTDPRLTHAIEVAAAADELNPKTEKVKEIVAEQLQAKPGSKIIVFTNYRDTAEVVSKALAEIEGVKPVRFVGQASKLNDKGLSQKKQVEILDKFRAGEYNALIATSVAEEGLDIPSTDMVLFYEPVPSEIRSIQRRGRTGRNTVGRVVVLMSRGTRDEGAYRVSQSKEKRMYKTMQHMKDGQAMMDVRINGTAARDTARAGSRGRDRAGRSRTARVRSPGAATSGACRLRRGRRRSRPPGRPAWGRSIKRRRQSRSRSSWTAGRCGRPSSRRWRPKNVKMDFRALPVGDYVLSDRVCVERKTTDDFLNTLFDPSRGLFEQIIAMKREYLRPMLIIEGEGLYTKRRISPEAIHGIIASIMVDYGIPVLFTASEEDTASYIYTIARREQLDRKRTVNPHARKSSQTLSERQEYLVSAISEVGPVIARNLLGHFGSVKNIAEASVDELQAVDKVGPKTAARIREIMDSLYQPHE